jgi:hypothetical protein
MDLPPSLPPHGSAQAPSPEQKMLADYTDTLKVARACVQDPSISNHTTAVLPLFDMFCARHPYILRPSEPYCTQLLNHFMANTQLATSFLHTNESTALGYSLAVPYPPTTTLLLLLTTDIIPGRLRRTSPVSNLSLCPPIYCRITKLQPSFRHTKLPCPATAQM